MALAAAKDAFSHRMQEKGNTNAKFWSAHVLAALGGERHWHQVGLRQLRCARRMCGLQGQQLQRDGACQYKLDDGSLCNTHTGAAPPCCQTLLPLCLPLCPAAACWSWCLPATT